MDGGLRFLVIGAGSIGKRHMRCLMSLGQEVAVFDVDKPRAREAGGLYGIQSYEDLGSALDAGFDAALVCTPSAFHMEPAMKAADKGLGLFVEKPLSHDMDGVDQLIEAARAKGLKTLVGCNLRFFRALNWAKDALASGEAGRLLSARISVGTYLPYWHPGEDYTKSYSANKSMGGGIILDAIHELDYMRWILGEAAEVYCMSKNTGALKIDTEDLACMIITLEDGLVVEVHLDYLQRTARRQAEFICEDGIIVCDLIGQSVEVYGKEPNQCRRRSEGLGADMNHMYVEQMAHFVRVIRGEEESVNPLDSAKKALELALAAKESAERRMPVRLG